MNDKRYEVLTTIMKHGTPEDSQKAAKLALFAIEQELAHVSGKAALVQSSVEEEVMEVVQETEEAPENEETHDTAPENPDVTKIIKQEPGAHAKPVRSILETHAKDHCLFLPENPRHLANFSREVTKRYEPYLSFGTQRKYPPKYWADIVGMYLDWCASDERFKSLSRFAELRHTFTLDQFMSCLEDWTGMSGSQQGTRMREFWNHLHTSWSQDYKLEYVGRELPEFHFQKDHIDVLLAEYNSWVPVNGSSRNGVPNKTM